MRHKRFKRNCVTDISWGIGSLRAFYKHTLLDKKKNYSRTVLFVINAAHVIVFFNLYYFPAHYRTGITDNINRYSRMIYAFLMMIFYETVLIARRDRFVRTPVNFNTQTFHSHYNKSLNVTVIKSYNLLYLFKTNILYIYFPVVGNSFHDISREFKFKFVSICSTELFNFF